MSHPDDCSSLLLETVDRLTAVGIPYMVAGSYAVVLHGQPRATQDVDIVVAPTADQVEAFIALVEKDQYVSPPAARTALAELSLFNVIDTLSGWKVDLIVRKARPFSLEEFARRRPIEFFGKTIYVVSPEDSILSKLEWSKKGNSERQLRDAESVAVLQWKDLDVPYLRRWAAELGVVSELDIVLHRAADLQAHRSNKSEGTP
jgi:hypothetical protein